MRDNIVITFGTFDLFHIGHLNILNRCKKYGNKLIVGISSDNLNYVKKGRKPIYNENDRMNIIKNIKCVDDVFIEDKLEDKIKYCKKYNANVFIIGDDWKDKIIPGLNITFDEQLKDVCEVIYLKRTDNISTTDTIINIKNYY
jgi:glycerol-3-phosphate cytidylyltransferase